MADLRESTGRVGAKRKIATAGLAIAIGSMLLATEFPSAVLSAGGGTAALAELVARSPGSRVGGVALKAKDRRAALAASNSPIGGPSDTAPGAALSPLAASAPAPEGAVPGFVAPGAFPSDVFPPAVPDLAVGGPGGDIPPGLVFGGTPLPSGGGGAIFVPGGGGGGGGGSGGGGTGSTPGSPNPPPSPLPTGTVPGIVAPVPEPGTWLLLIGGFGAIGAAMRRRRSTAVA